MLLPMTDTTSYSSAPQPRAEVLQRLRLFARLYSPTLCSETDAGYDASTDFPHLGSTNN